MPRRTLILVIGLVIITIILFVIALSAGNTKIPQPSCSYYSNLPLQQIPARCIKYFQR